MRKSTGHMLVPYVGQKAWASAAAPVLAWALAIAGALLPLSCVPEGPATGDDPAGPTTASPSAAAGAKQPRAASSAAKQASPQSSASGAATTPDPRIEAPFTDTFDRPQLGVMYNALSPVWRIENGELCGQGAKNRGVWLRMRLPENALVRFEAYSHSDDGDIKVELWGDGRSGATGSSYDDASGYIAIFGGWRNQLHVLARLDEHKRDRKLVRLSPDGEDVRTRPVATGQRYRFELERRDGRTLRWSVDDTVIHTFDDPRPLKGLGHEHFGFNDWKTRVCFDNLHIEPLD